MTDRVYYSKEAEKQASRERMTLVLVFLSLGLSIGAAIAMLLAPKSGEENRQAIASALEEGLKPVGETANKVVGQIGEQINSLRKTVEDRIADIR
jgi:gas vesicle protein